MTSIDFLNKVHKILDSQEYNLSYSPAKSKNYMLYCNGNFIGGLFDEELCFVYADSVSELLGHPEPVYRGYSSTAQHRMLVIPEEHWSKALKLSWGMSKGASLAPQEIKMLLAVLPETKSQGLFHQIQKEVTFCGLLHGAYA